MAEGITETTATPARPRFAYQMPDFREVFAEKKQVTLTFMQPQAFLGLMQGLGVTVAPDNFDQITRVAKYAESVDLVLDPQAIRQNQRIQSLQQDMLATFGLRKNQAAPQMIQNFFIGQVREARGFSPNGHSYTLTADQIASSLSTVPQE